MAFGVTWHDLEPLKLRPIGPRLRVLHAVRPDATRESLGRVARTYNWGLTEWRQRGHSQVFVNDLQWTDNAYNAANQISWRQPFTPGFQDVRYRFHVQIPGGNAGELRVQGADAAWTTGAVAAGGAWQDVTISNVDLAGAGVAEYFTPILQGKVNGSDTLHVRTMGWVEQPLSAPPNGGIDSDGDGSADTYGADDAVTWDPDAPLSAGAAQDISDGLLQVYDQRTRLLVCRIIPDGRGAHPDDRWTSAAADHPAIWNDRLATGCVARLVLSPDPQTFRQLTIMVEGQSDGIKEGGIRFAVGPSDGEQEELTWGAGAAAWAWDSVTFPAIDPRRHSIGGHRGTEMWITIRDDLEVRSLLIFAADTNWAA